MFVGFDAKSKFGLIDFDPSLIEMWEKPKELRRVWNLAIMSSLSGGQLNWDDIKEFKMDHTKGKEFKQYLALNSGHAAEVRAELALAAAKINAEKKKQALLQKKKEKDEKDKTVKKRVFDKKAAEKEQMQQAKIREMTSDARGQI